MPRSCEQVLPISGKERHRMGEILWKMKPVAVHYDDGILFSK